MNSKGSIAISQILILIIGIIAIGYLIGSEARMVSALTPEDVANIAKAKSLIADSKDLGTKIEFSPAITQSLKNADIPIQADNSFATSNLVDYFKAEDAAMAESVNKFNPSLKNNLPDATFDNTNLAETGLVKNTPAITGGTPAAGTKIPGEVKTSSFTGDTLTSTYGTGYKLTDGTTITSGSVKIGGTSYDTATYGDLKINDAGGGNWQVTDAKGTELKLAKDQPVVDKTAQGVETTSSWYGSGTVWGALYTGVIWAGVCLTVVGLVGLFAPDSWKPYTDALLPALGVGAFVGGTLFTALGKGGTLFKNIDSQSSLLGWTKADAFMGMTGGQVAAIGIGLAIAAAIFLYMFEQEEKEVVTFTCYPWDAPTGGANCEKCNAQNLPCSEYQCKSLGQGCQLQNPNTASPLCSWVNKGDVVAPVITLWNEVLTTKLKYSPEGAKSPEDKGVRILNTDSKDGCLAAYTPLIFGIKTDEPARCKIDTTGKQNFSDMNYYFGGSSLFSYNHTHIMSLPGVDTGENKSITLKNDGELKVYVRCQDPNGNYNIGNWVFRMCVDQGPDTTAPLIIGTNLVNGMPIAYNTSSLNVELYTNEPADCKFDKLDKGEYEKMDSTMSCSKTALEMNAQMVYTCKSTLTGIKSGSGSENNFYFKCRDKPQATKDRNTNAENYKFTILGTQPLILDKVGPNGTIKDNTNPVVVKLTAETSAGYKDGESACYYSLDGKQKNYVKFFVTDSFTHSQELSLGPGSYNVSIKCVDLGGNSATSIAKFTVEPDTRQPSVVRVFHEGTNLRTITDEYAQCVYSTTDCNYQFNDGVAMTTIDDVNQYTEWKLDQTLYMKCKDKYGNQPDAKTCTFEVKPYESI